MKNIAIKYGIIGGITGAILMLVLWFVSPRSFLSYHYYMGAVVIMFFMYKSAADVRALYGGYISFGEVFKPLFITFVIGTFIFALMQFLMYNVIDPGLIDLQREMVQEALDKMSQMIDNEEFTEKMEEALDENNFDLSFFKIMRSWVFSLIWGAIISAIMSAIMKKREPISFAENEVEDY